MGKKTTGKKPTITLLLLEGKTDEEIMQILGCKKSSILLKRKQLSIRIPHTECDLEEPVKCSEKYNTCYYRSSDLKLNRCDYITMTGHMRGGDPECCVKYRHK